MARETTEQDLDPQDLEADAPPAAGSPSAIAADAGAEPVAAAMAWLREAEGAEPEDANAMALATSTPEGLPNVRMVLLKEIEPPRPDSGFPGAFVFYTNFDSAKGGELARNRQAALVLHWKSLRRQVRARGRVEKIDDAQADAYYASRAYQSRLGAWASQQSRPLESRGALLAEVAKIGARHPLKPPRPPYWGGFRIIPSEVELWSDGAFRLHDRVRWTREGAAWRSVRLQP